MLQLNMAPIPKMLTTPGHLLIDHSTNHRSELSVIVNKNQRLLILKTLEKYKNMLARSRPGQSYLELVLQSANCIPALH